MNANSLSNKIAVLAAVSFLAASSLTQTAIPTPSLQQQAGYGHFFTGDYVNEIFQTLGGSHDANWVYVQAQFAF